MKYVINYDFPNSVENYVHRIGRTARANATGTAYTFLTELHSKFVIPLIEVLREANHTPTPDLLRMADKFSIERYGRSEWYKISHLYYPIKPIKSKLNNFAICGSCLSTTQSEQDSFEYIHTISCCCDEVSYVT